MSQSERSIFSNQVNSNNIELRAFQSVYSSTAVSSLISKHCFKGRNRAFTPLITLGAWLAQVLAADRSCTAAVARINADRISSGIDPVSPNTGAYCSARERLPEALLEEMLVQEARQLEKCVPSKWTWNGRSVRLVDGMTVTLCETDRIKEEFPLTERQERENSLPLARIVGLFSLATGGLLDVAIGAYCGRKTGEHVLLRELMPSLNQGELLLGDGLYPSYFCMAALISKGIDGVFAAGKRNVDFRCGKRIGRKDHIIEWKKAPRPDWMSQKEYDQIQSMIKVRELEVTVERPGFRPKKKILFTTLTDKKLASIQNLSLLFTRRWEIETHFRTIKSNLKMNFISSRTPSMVRKSIYMTFIGYNLIRKIMSEAAILAECLPTQISFQRTAQILETYKKLWEIGKMEVSTAYSQILLAVSKGRVGNRPFRTEPRRMRRAKHRYPLLKKKRASAKNSIFQKYSNAHTLI